MNLIHGLAPDGSDVYVDLDETEGECCPGFNHFGCTLAEGHPGPWHIADDGTKILEVWPV